MGGQHVVFVHSTGVSALERCIVERMERLGMRRLWHAADEDGPTLSLQVLAHSSGWLMMRAAQCWFWWSPASDEADLTAPHTTCFEYLLGDQRSAWLMATHVTYRPGESPSPRHVLMECGNGPSHLSAAPCDGVPGLFAGRVEHPQLQPRHPLLVKPWQAWRSSASAGSPPDEALGLSLMARSLSRHLIQRDLWTRTDWRSLGGTTWQFALPQRSSWHMPLWTQPMAPMPRDSQPAPLPTPEVRYAEGQRVRVGDEVVLRHSQRIGQVVTIMQVNGLASGVVVRMGSAETGQRALWVVRQGVLDDAVCLQREAVPAGLAFPMRNAGTALTPASHRRGPGGRAA